MTLKIEGQCGYTMDHVSRWWAICDETGETVAYVRNLRLARLITQSNDIVWKLSGKEKASA